MLSTHASPAVLLIRLIVGIVFLSEGIRKFLFPDQLGVGRFLKIGIPMPQVMAPFVGVCEIVFGVLMLTRAAVIPLIIDHCGCDRDSEDSSSHQEWSLGDGPRSVR
jgi:uncharacterized membrane protein YphA (DoxX/SURF4 family)